MQAETISKPIYMQIREAKEADKRSNRWLILELRELGIFLNDAQMSNRLSGNREFLQNEVVGCEKIFKKKFKAQS